MIIVTSLSPNHTHATNQQAAIDSWQKFGNCVSLNSVGEISVLNNKYTGIKLCPTHRTLEHLYSKPLININEFFNFADEVDDDLLLVNSDIIINELPELKQDGITVFSRYDYTTDMNSAKKFDNGFDGFYIPEKFLQIFPPSIYALGACWHDYFTPMIAINKGVKIYTYNKPYCFHKTHEVHYPVQEYFDIGEVFRWEFKFKKKFLVPYVAQLALSIINSKLIRL